MPVACRIADARRGRPDEGDLRPGTRPARIPQPSPRRSRPLRGCTLPRRGHRSLSSDYSPASPSSWSTICTPTMRRLATRERHAEPGPAMAVQHHHAHVASCMAENGLNEPVIGVTFDGTGYGTDGTIWGGEFLIGDYQAFRRAAHLRPVRMPGGETGDSRALADGGGLSRRRRAGDRSRLAVSHPPRAISDRRAHARARLQLADHVQRGPALRRRRRARRRPADRSATRVRPRSSWNGSLAGRARRCVSLRDAGTPRARLAI